RTGGCRPFRGSVTSRLGAFPNLPPCRGRWRCGPGPESPGRSPTPPRRARDLSLDHGRRILHPRSWCSSFRVVGLSIEPYGGESVKTFPLAGLFRVEHVFLFVPVWPAYRVYDEVGGAAVGCDVYDFGEVSRVNLHDAWASSCVSVRGRWGRRGACRATMR